MEIATSLGRNGLQDWLMQRVTAIVLSLYAIFLIPYLYITPQLTYTEWHKLFSSEAMRYSTMLVLLSLIVHAWIGVWTITTDYIKPLAIRLTVQLFVMSALIVCLIWGIQILWIN